MTLPNPEEITAALDASKERECHAYATVFRTLASEHPDKDWGMLQTVFNYHFRKENVAAPFGPMAVMDGNRTGIPEDLQDDQLDALESTLVGVEDPEYRARVADVLWLRRRNPQIARQAVADYLESGKRLEDPERWTRCMERYERALRLARQIEPKGELPKTILSHLQDRVFHYDGSDPLYFTSHALELLTYFRYGDFQKLATIAGRIAEESRKRGDYRRARTYYGNQAGLLKLAKEAAAAERALDASAETTFEEAEAREAAGDFMAAHAFFADVIREFRNRPSLRDRVADIQARYSKLGEKVLEGMSPVTSGEIDISKYVQRSKEAVAGLNWDDAFFTLLTYVPLIDPAKLRMQVEKQSHKTPFQAMVASSIYDAAGRKIGVRPSAFTDDPAQLELAMEGFMERDASIHRDLSVNARIAPMMRQMLTEHEISKETIAKLIGDSELLPEDRKDWFFEAFAAGFASDFSAALHILIPQVENALRHMLQQYGVTPSNVDVQGIEEVWGLERILAHETTRKTLGEDFVFELKSLLVGRLGPNYRNLFAHGLLSPGAMQTATSLYLWWLIMRLASFPTSGMAAFIERRRANR